MRRQRETGGLGLSKPCFPAEKSAVKPFPFGGFIRFVSALLRKDYQFIWRRL